MDRPLDLPTASRGGLLGYIATLEAAVATLQQRVADLEQRLSSGGGHGMPGLKPATQTRSKATGQPRKRRPHGFARRRSPTPTQQVHHAVAQCPDCGTRLQGGWVQRRRQVIDLPVVPAEVVEHCFITRQCPVCARRVTPAAAVALAGAVSGQQRPGARLVSVIATLREVGRLPVGTIQWVLERLYHLHLSVGAIVGASHWVAARGAATVTAIRDQIRASPGVHADETGWRENGHNGYVWTFCTPTARYFVRRGRGKEVVDEVLGDTFSGVLSSDFYAAYHHYPGLKQRCWAHLLREIHDLRRLYPADVAFGRWATRVHRLYQQAVAQARAATAHGLDPRARLRTQQRYEQRLMAICRPYLDDPAAVQGPLCRRIARHLPELFVFVAQPAVPPDNNAAERSLRPLVTSRKVSGGTRSPAGTTTKMATASLFGTWLARGLDPLTACQQLLTSPQV